MPDIPKSVSEYFSKLGKKGGKARMATLSKKQRSELGTMAIKARWGKK